MPRIHDLPSSIRPRERLWREGPQALSEAELIALVIRDGRVGENALQLAMRLLADFGGLEQIASAGPEELAIHPGLGPAKAASILAALHLAKRSWHPPQEAPLIESGSDLAFLAFAALAGSRRERVLVLVLDSANHVRHSSMISEGAVDRSTFPIREILNLVSRHDGRAFAIAHNHPAGAPTPSSTDLAATSRIREAARTVGLRFIDHVIVGHDSWFSFALGTIRKRPTQPSAL